MNVKEVVHLRQPLGNAFRASAGRGSRVDVGKNVVSHVGKSYSIVAHQIGGELLECPDIAEATCVLVSRVGWPVETPRIVELQIQTRNAVALETLREPAEAIARECLRGVTELTRLLLDHASIESPAAWPGVLLF